MSRRTEKNVIIEDAKNSRPEPFHVARAHSVILDYACMFNKSGTFMSKSKTLKIGSYQRFNFQNGILSASCAGNCHISKPFVIMSRRNVHLDEVHPEELFMYEKVRREVQIFHSTLKPTATD